MSSSSSDNVSATTPASPPTIPRYSRTEATTTCPSPTCRSPTRGAHPSGTCTPHDIEACRRTRPAVPHITSASHVLLSFRLLFSDRSRRKILFTNWIHIPLGITSLLVLVWAIKQAMDRAPFRFPSPVIAMLVTFLVLLTLDYLSGFTRRSKETGEKPLLQPVLSVLEPPCDFCLKYMSVMFTPSFILIPAREVIGGKEIGLITAWFAVSQVLALLFPVFLHKALRALRRRASSGRRDSMATLVGDTGAEEVLSKETKGKHPEGQTADKKDGASWLNKPDVDIEDHGGCKHQLPMHPSRLLVRTATFSLHSAPTWRALAPPARPQSASSAALSPTFDQYIFSARQEQLSQRCQTDMLAPHETRRGSIADSQATVTGDDKMESAQEDDAVERLADRINESLAWVVVSMLLIVGLPLFYCLDISLPLFLAVNLLTFLCAITVVGAKVRQYAHPILTTSIATILIVWALGGMRKWSLKQTLGSYSVDAKYTVVWDPSGYTGRVIGAGDVLFSTLDAGIVALAIPMYRYRRDLWMHLFEMLIVLLPCATLSLFVWPTVAALMGIQSERALTFASRFMSTPLAIECSQAIGADQSLTVVLVVITGILISIFKDPFFRICALNPTKDQDAVDDSGTDAHDYLTIGIAMGSTAGAIGASSLLAQPRCMAIASLSFVLFGAIMLIFAAIPPIVSILQQLT